MQGENKCSETTKQEKSILTESLQHSIHNIAKKEGYMTYNVHERNNSTNGGNFLGVLYEVDIKGKTNDGNKETNLFIKNIVNTDDVKDYFSLPDAYLRESFVYNEVSKIFTDLQNKANIPLEERFNMVKGYDESNSEAIILENVVPKGYKTPYRKDVPSLKFTEMTIQQLARFHGLSFVIQKQRPTFYEKLVSLDIAVDYNDFWKKEFYKFTNMSTKKLTIESKKKVDSHIEKLVDIIPRCIKDRNTVCCLSHGDFRLSNILMKETDGEITKIIPVDYQIAHYGCPVNDFIFFIYSCTDRQFRNDHIEYLKDTYYDSLRKFLKYFGMDVESIFSRKEFENIYRNNLDYGLATVFLFYPMFFASEEDLPDVAENDFSDFDPNLDKSTSDRIQEVVDEFIEWGFI